MTRTVYQPPAGIAVRGVGLGALGIGLAIVGATVVLAVELPSALRVALTIVCAVLAVVALLVLVVGVVRSLGWGVRLVLDDDGFTNATGPGSGVRRVAWKDVRKVQADGDVVSVDVAGNRQSVIRTTGIDVDPRELARELRAHLNRDRGYRPLNS